MTGTTTATHGDRVFRVDNPMPRIPTLAQTFRDNDYQAYAVGKLHVYPQRDRIGFDDVILAEEGRPNIGALDDYEAFLGENGYAGEGFTHGMSNNDYGQRPWHLPEAMHVTNWTTRQMARMIRRRDPTRPGFWYLSYCHPHPPLTPLQCYLDLYRDEDPGELQQNTVAAATLLMSVGIDPERSTLFVQSAVSEHAELAWMMECTVGFGELRRMTQFKDKSDRSEFVSAGLFTYPALQASDILFAPWWTPPLPVRRRR